MRNSIKKRFDELSAVAARIIKHGVQLSCALMFTALVLIRVENYIALSKYITESAVSVFAIVVIGGLMFDYCAKKGKGNG